MKKLAVILLGMCMFIAAAVNVFADTEGDNPVISFEEQTPSKTLYENEPYQLEINIENMKFVEDVDVILHYNTDVLLFAPQIRTESPDIRQYQCTALPGEKDGEIRISIIHAYENVYDNSYITFVDRLLFSPIAAGDTGFYAEIVTDDCNTGSIQVDMSGLSKEVVSDTSQIDMEYAENRLKISGNGRIARYISKYDTQNVLPEDMNEVKSLVIEEGITEVFAEYNELRVRSEDEGGYASLRETDTGLFTETLKDIWLPDSLENLVFSRYSGIGSYNYTIHANAMTYAEKLASQTQWKFEFVNDFKRGDIDKNDVYEADDALCILKMAAQLEDLYKWSADIDENGTVDANDALKVLKIAAKLE